MIVPFCHEDFAVSLLLTVQIIQRKNNNNNKKTTEGSANVIRFSNLTMQSILFSVEVISIIHCRCTKLVIHNKLPDKCLFEVCFCPHRGYQEHIFPKKMSNYSFNTLKYNTIPPNGSQALGMPWYLQVGGLQESGMTEMISRRTTGSSKECAMHSNDINDRKYGARL